jgi:hypothetical protein
MRNARPIMRKPYRIPHALKPVVDEHVNDALKIKIIEPSTSPWSCSIVLVQKKLKDGNIKYRFSIDYRSLSCNHTRCLPYSKYYRYFGFIKTK